MCELSLSCCNPVRGSVTRRATSTCHVPKQSDFGGGHDKASCREEETRGAFRRVKPSCRVGRLVALLGAAAGVVGK